MWQQQYLRIRKPKANHFMLNIGLVLLSALFETWEKTFGRIVIYSSTVRVRQKRTRKMRVFSTQFFGSFYIAPPICQILMPHRIISLPITWMHYPGIAHMAHRHQQIYYHHPKNMWKGSLVPTEYLSILPAPIQATQLLPLSPLTTCMAFPSLCCSLSGTSYFSTWGNLGYFHEFGDGRW